MKRSAFLSFAAFATVFGFSSSAHAQLLQSCYAQCQQTYDTRANYCYSRYGGYNYDAELCIMNEYEVLVDCQRNCDQAYGDGYAGLNLARVPGIHGQARSCA